jgi:hypothetical protein
MKEIDQGRTEERATYQGVMELWEAQRETSGTESQEVGAALWTHQAALPLAGGAVLVIQSTTR